MRFSHKFTMINVLDIRIYGPATTRCLNKLIPAFRYAIAAKKDVTIDLSKTCAIDTRFLGLLLVLRKNLRSKGANLILTGLSSGLERAFRRNCVGFLLAAGKGGKLNETAPRAEPQGTLVQAARMGPVRT